MRGKIAFAALVATGCTTTPTSIRQSEPKAVYSTSRPMPQVKRCLSENLSHLGGPSVIQDEIETLTFGSGGITSLMIDLSPGQVTVRSGYPYFANVRKRVEACVA